MTEDDANILPQSLTITVPIPHCYNMEELPTASSARAQTIQILSLIKEKKTLSPSQLEFQSSPLFTHLSSGLALTTGSALGYKPPTPSQCLASFQAPNKVGLTAGARAWTKHAHRSQQYHPSAASKKNKGEPGWWGHAQGPRDILNEGAHTLFCKIVKEASWRNLHMLPHDVLAYEMRVPEGYGMRWSRDLKAMKEKKEGFEDGHVGDEEKEDGPSEASESPWTFRGFVEPMMENGHELGWRHELTRPPSMVNEKGQGSEAQASSSSTCECSLFLSCTTIELFPHRTSNYRIKSQLSRII
ncbi:hypothetical protein AN958_02055 [Leucoagaricus sp. SymC.cos]|nr:hypothetical protein AN958_02055 [Leucoagaricus sp. SymC.cos]